MQVADKIPIGKIGIHWNTKIMEPQVPAIHAPFEHGQSGHVIHILYQRDTYSLEDSTTVLSSEANAI